jgi:site-specific recombinase XerD
MFALELLGVPTGLILARNPSLAIRAVIATERCTVANVDDGARIDDDPMPDALPVVVDHDAVALSSELADLLRHAEEYAAAATSENTTKAYASDWRGFTGWCARHQLVPLPAEPLTVALYATWEARSGRKSSTIRRHAAAIARVHRDHGHPNPLWDPRVALVLEGIARTHRNAPKKKVALLRDPITQIVERIEITTTEGLRDRALILLGFALGLRRSELVAIGVDDLSPDHDGLRIRLGGSKTDQTGRGHEFLLPYAKASHPCPVRAIRAWIDHAQITDGPIARRLHRGGKIGAGLSAQSVALIVKRRAEVAGLNPADFAGHSLRSGFTTQAVRDGHRLEQIADVTRHKDRRTMDGYIRAGKGAGDVARVL